MSSPSDKETGTASSANWAERVGRLKNAALFTAVIGFGLQVAGTLTSHAQLAQVGMGMFLFGLPTFFIGLYLSRRWQKPSPAPAVQKGPGRRPRRKRK